MEQDKNGTKIEKKAKRPRIKRPVFSTKEENNNSNKTKFDKK
jgi:hypothetical protein